MIKPTEAIENATTKKMNKEEKLFYDLLSLYSDSWINRFFNGKSVDIDITNATLRTDTPLIGNDGKIIPNVEIVTGGKYHNSVTGQGRIPYWRQTIVIKNWVESYEKEGWIVKVEDNKEVGDYATYTFEPNYRKIKLDKID